MFSMLVFLMQLCGRGQPPNKSQDFTPFLRDSDRAVWSEVSEGLVEIRSVSMLGPEAAVVAGSINHYGTMIFKRSTPFRVLMRKEDGGWRVVRSLAGVCAE